MKFRYLLILLISLSSMAQETSQSYSFSMEEAMEFGLENNYTSVNAQKYSDFMFFFILPMFYA